MLQLAPRFREMRLALAHCVNRHLQIIKCAPQRLIAAAALIDLARGQTGLVDALEQEQLGAVRVLGDGAACELALW